MDLVEIVLAAGDQVSEADDVLRNLIVILGGLNIGSALMFALWHLRSGKKGRVKTAAFLLAYCDFAGLTTDHVYRHLTDNDASTWLLWMTLLGFSVGAASLIASLVAAYREGKAVPIEEVP
jgi:hypothetical protein